MVAAVLLLEPTETAAARPSCVEFPWLFAAGALPDPDRADVLEQAAESLRPTLRRNHFGFDGLTRHGCGQEQLVL